MTTPSASIPLVSTIFGLTYLALAVGKVPGLRTDRAGIALVGAAVMLACGVLSMGDAARAVDYETIVLLFGMMVVVAYLRMAGFFALATEQVAARCSGPLSLLAVTIAISGTLSAFLVNDVVCVALTPLVLHLCQRLKRPPKGSSKMQNVNADSPACNLLSRSSIAVAVCAGTWMLRVTLVAPLPSAIVWGEKVAVYPCGSPEVVNVIAGSVVPREGLTFSV